ncbi:MAG: DUF5777 family beta-barrel protein [Bacteroidia bacterium]
MKVSGQVVNTIFKLSNLQIVKLALFVLCLTLVSSLYAQNKNTAAATYAKSTRTTIINGKKYYLHKVAHAQSLYGISKIYNVDVKAILDENPGAIKGIVVGQDLKIPFETSTSVTKTKPVEVNKPKVEQPKQEVPANNADNSQEPDLLSMVDEGKKEKEYVSATFKSTRNINFHTAEVLGKRCLDFRIQHRFGNLTSTPNTAWGIDGAADLMLSLEYSPNGRWMVGVSRCILNSMAEGFFKWKMIRQVKHGFPFTITYFGGVYNTFASDPFLGQPIEFYNAAHPAERMSFVHQLIIACRITPWLSMQVAPAYVHYNLVGTGNGFSKNDCMAILGVVRAKFSKRQAIIFEYGYRLNTDYAAAGSTYYNSMGIGWEVETGGHVFQLFLTNSFGILENQYIMGTTTSWQKVGKTPAGIRIGFNITRVFALSKKSEI